MVATYSSKKRNKDKPIWGSDYLFNNKTTYR